MTAPTGELVALADTDQTVAGTDADIRGLMVRDSAGEEIGEIDDLLIDLEENRVRFLVVASGGFLGIGEDKSYLPVDAITGIDDAVRIDLTRERVAGAPRYDPDLVNDRDYNERAFGYYGYTPYWTAGYGYPAFPYYA